MSYDYHLHRNSQNLAQLSGCKIDKFLIEFILACMKLHILETEDLIATIV